MTPRVVLLSLWQNDADRDLLARAEHLWSKTYPTPRWVWVIGDSQDGTLAMLHEARQAATPDRRARTTIVDLGDTGCPGADHHARLHRLSVTVNAALGYVHRVDNYVCWHESDLQSPPDVVERLLATGHPCVAGWPMLRGNGYDQFYDTWAFRGLDGAHLTAEPPHHPDYRPDVCFEVSSFGSVYLFPAAAVRQGLQATTRACVDLCAGLRAQGHTLWVDPTCEVVQPADLWVPQRWAAEVGA